MRRPYNRPDMGEKGDLRYGHRKILTHSAKIETADLDWAEAKRLGLKEDEVFILTYFSDIESQTIIYLRDSAPHRKRWPWPDTIAFLSMEL